MEYDDIDIKDEIETGNAPAKAPEEEQRVSAILNLKQQMEWGNRKQLKPYYLYSFPNSNKGTYAYFNRQFYHQKEAG